ncbi:hypothetical protein RRG08_013996 [Elysia crispata]|uniref:Uncharacterized protein n=1 Tax=Elysia crispata TaxID=231223 RepID=A0AAE0Z3P5_9GAST|nr:hypothetical protein RRG08_013996 [Elysia crispata]
MSISFLERSVKAGSGPLLFLAELGLLVRSGFLACPPNNPSLGCKLILRRRGIGQASHESEKLGHSRLAVVSAAWGTSLSDHWPRQRYRLKYMQVMLRPYLQWPLFAYNTFSFTVEAEQDKPANQRSKHVGDEELLDLYKRP